MPGPGYVWIDGFYSPNGWVAGYWSLPPAPGAFWVAPTFVGGRFVAGYWGGPRFVNHAAFGFHGPAPVVRGRAFGFRR
jgi:hypothetical protein